VGGGHGGRRRVRVARIAFDSERVARHQVELQRRPPRGLGHRADRATGRAPSRSPDPSCPSASAGSDVPRGWHDHRGDRDWATRAGGQVRRARLLRDRGVCHRSSRPSTPPSAASRARQRRAATSGARDAVRLLGPGTPRPRRIGGGSMRRCPPPLLRRAVCLPSAASSPPTARSRQALRFASLRESCRTRA
jgi:hypothetical protein